MKPDLILLDCDGVIVDTEPTTNAILSESLQSHGLLVSQQDCIDMFVGGTLADVERKVRDKGINLPQDWLAGIYDLMFERLGQGVDLFDGTLEFLDKAEKMGIPVCVLSNGPLAKMKITLSQHGLWDRLGDRIYSGHTKGNNKPDPGMIVDAMDRFNTTRAKTWMVDDSASGLTAGIRAGVTTFAFVPVGAHLPDVDFTNRVTGFAQLSAHLD